MQVRMYMISSVLISSAGTVSILDVVRTQQQPLVFTG
jgi:UDP-N-acetylglucosamine transferase subunit ALG13